MVETYDVVVLGSGAAGLTAALAAAVEGATVLVLEKADLVGGTTALSGGTLWIPNNQPARDLGIDDSRERGLAYLTSLSNAMILPELAEALVDGGPEMVDFVHANTELRFRLVEGYPDYHPERPGGLPGGGRSIEVDLVSFAGIEEWEERVSGVPSRMLIREMPLGGGTGVLPPEVAAEREEARLEGLGRGLVAGLLKACLQHGVEVRPGTAAAGLTAAPADGVGLDTPPPTSLRSVAPSLGARGRASSPRGLAQSHSGSGGSTSGGPATLVEQGGRPRPSMSRPTHSSPQITGVELADGTTIETAAVVLATGGFEYDDDLVRDFLRGPVSRPLGAPTNTGDGLRMAMRLGARLGNMREAWWAPIVPFPGTRRDGADNAQLASRERALPGSMMVNAAGRRFANEAANYNAFGGAYHYLDASRFEYPNLPSYMLFDQSVIDRFGMFGTAPGTPVPDWVVRADSIGDLADALGLPKDEVEASVKQFNEYARAGEDPDFGRGASAFDRFPGGRSTGEPDDPRSTLGPLETAPFYGVEVQSSLLGTKGGPRTDVRARVLDVDGAPIRGLYAAGNAMANPTGMVYGGAGATLAVACVFGMYAGRTAAQER